MVERYSYKVDVLGSIPSAPTPMSFVPKIVKFSVLKVTRDRGYILNKFLMHPFPKGYPQVETITILRNKVEREDIVICRRLLKAYKLATKLNISKNPALPAGRKKDIWTDLATSYHREFIDVLQEGSPETLAKYLLSVHARGISQGLVQGEIEYQKLRSSQIFRRFTGVNIKDKLVALAEYLSVLPYENPEQGTYGANIYKDENKLILEIEKRLKIKITTPDFENALFKLKLRSGSLHVRDIYALYTAIRVLETAGKKVKVAEIGGGVGKAAYYSYKLGIRDYSIFDLSYINVLQGYFLLKSFPNSVSLYGEKPKAIKVLPDFMFAKMPKNRFDLTLNEDSFPEINPGLVRNYLKDIRRNTKKYLLSINQEGESSFAAIKQSIVGKIIEEAGGFKKEYRFPFWVRKGYIEELYIKRPKRLIGKR